MLPVFHIFSSTSPCALLFIVSSAIFLLLRRRHRRRQIDHQVYIVPSDIDKNHQSNILDSQEKIHYSIFADSPNDFKLSVIDPLTGLEAKNLYDLCDIGRKLSNDGQCLGCRKGDRYEWMNYGEVLARARNFGAGLISLGLKSGQQTFVGIYSRTRLEWDLSALACSAYSMVVVPLYDTLGPDAVTFVVNQADIQLIICDDQSKIGKILENISTTPNLQYIICMDDVNSADFASKPGHVIIKSFVEMEQMGKNEPQEMLIPEKDDLYIICYTSGTTGNPKGIQITHGNLVGQIASLRCVMEKYGIVLGPEDAAIAYLPLAHMFEQAIHAACYSYGARIGYYGGDVAHLLDDVRLLKPKFLPVVPRLLNRLYDNVRAKIAAGNILARCLFKVAYFFKKRDLLTRNLIRKDTIWDYLIFRKIQNILGGNVSFVVTGSAPVLPDVKTFSWTILGAVILEAYGQTEVTAGITATLPDDTEVGHVGALLPNCWVKLTDVPELEYYAVNEQGEICVKGPCFPKGYFKEPEKTAELFDDKGWLHTGDIGMWTQRGTLKIIDRKKNILKLAQGEYVAPEKIENVYSRCPFVSQIFVDGRSLETYLVAVVVPNKEEIQRRIEKKNQFHQFLVIEKYEDSRQFWTNAKLVAKILEEMRAVGKENGLNSLEQVKAIKFYYEESFTVENGLLTPTFKLKRPQLKKKFAQDIDELYKS